MSDYYHMSDDLLKKILTYLPAKSLVRFTSVCKSWNSLITGSDFITAHLNQTRVSNNDDGKHPLFFRYYQGKPEKERYSFRFDNHTFHEYEYNLIECPFKSYMDFHILGSCNGVICLSEEGTGIIYTVILWNPSIRKCLTLPHPQFRYRTHGFFEYAFGFGFDSRTNDYKVVLIVWLHLDSDHSPKVQLYKLSTGSWETITATIDPLIYVDYMFGTQAYINGAVHWPSFKSEGYGSLILSFNMSDEVFLEMSLPADIVEEYQDDKDLSIAVCGEWLSILHFTNFCSVWVMKEYGVVESWTQLYTFDLYGGLGKILGFRRNGELLLAMANLEIASYDPETRQIKNYELCEYDKYSSFLSFHVDAYVESLVLVGMQTDSGRTCDESKEEYESEDEQDFW